MKKIYLIFIFTSILIESVKCQNINGVAVYKKSIYRTYQNNDTNKESSKLYKMISDNLKNIEFKLLFNKNESIFKVEDVIDLEKNRPLKLAINFGGGRGVFYSNLVSGELIQQAEGFGELFLIEDNLKNYKWKLTNKDTIINTLKCRQAVTKIKQTRDGKLYNINVKAWYTEDIPYGFGPIGFGNLPGLIVLLKLQNGFQFKLSKFHINKNKELTIKKPEKGIKITREEFYNIRNKTLNKLRNSK